MPVLEKLCQFCGAQEGEGTFRKVANTCEACLRQRHRVGLTPCCGRLPVDQRHRYCPDCDGEGKVPVVLLTTKGRERITYHPLGLALAGTGGLTLAELARLRRRAADSLVLRVDPRSWHLGRLNLLPEDRPRPVLVVCKDCGRQSRRWKLRPSGRMPSTCWRCRQEKDQRWKSSARRALKARQRAAGLTCPLCRRPCGRLIGVATGRPCCEACDKRTKRYGKCAECEAPRFRPRGKPARCPNCDPGPRRPSMTVTLTDGRELREVEVSYGHGGALNGYLGALVLVPYLPEPGARLPLRQGVVIGGLRLPHFGPTARLGLLALSRARPADRAAAMRVLTDEFGESGRQVATRLTLAGLLGQEGLTARAEAVLRWVAARGIKL